VIQQNTEAARSASKTSDELSRDAEALRAALNYFRISTDDEPVISATDSGDAIENDSKLAA
jgi:hypothetical protein